MKNLKSLRRLQRLHKRITQENTGTPKELAGAMRISERSLYNLIDQLKDINAPVCYSRSRGTYYYSDDFQLEVNISIVALTHNEVINLFGGGYGLNPNYALEKYFTARFMQ